VKEVRDARTSGRPRWETAGAQRFAYGVVLALILAFIPSAVLALTITPSEVTLSDYSSSQEVVITFVNDQFEPLGCEIAPDPLSAHLLPYVRIEPNRFILQPNEQQNVRVTTAFPEAFPPQTHRLILHSYPGSKETATISFRPPGQARPLLQLHDLTTEIDEHNTLIGSFSLRNDGNVILFVTPQVGIRSAEGLVKEVTYPRAVVVQPGSVYPLTIRQELVDVPAGDYVAVFKATYYAERPTNATTTPEEVKTFLLSAEAAAGKKKAWWIDLAVGTGAIVFALGVWYAVATSKKRQGRRKHDRTTSQGGEPAHAFAPIMPQAQGRMEKHLTARSGEIATLRRDVAALQAETDILIRETTTFTAEARAWIASRATRRM
jgi:hypothetical protein